MAFEAPAYPCHLNVLPTLHTRHFSLTGLLVPSSHLQPLPAIPCPALLLFACMTPSGCGVKPSSSWKSSRHAFEPSQLWVRNIHEFRPNLSWTPSPVSLGHPTSWLAPLIPLPVWLPAFLPPRSDHVIPSLRNTLWLPLPAERKVQTLWPTTGELSPATPLTSLHHPVL